MPLELTATVAKIRYFNASNHFMVLSVVLDNESTMNTFVGYGFKPEVEGVYTFSGDYGMDQRYGMQFKFTRMLPYTPSSRDAIIAYFASSAFHGIGMVSAQKIVDTLGEDCIEQILNDPTILENVGLSENQVASVLTTLMVKDDGFHRNVTFLSECGLDIDQSHLIYQTYKDQTKKILQEDPFTPYYDLADIEFKSAVKIAEYLEFDHDDEVVQLAQVVHHLRHTVATSGSVYMDYAQLASFGLAKMGMDEPTLNHLIDRGITKELLVLEENRIYPLDQYLAECTIASYLKSFPHIHLEDVALDEVEQALDHYCSNQNIAYDHSQKNAILSAFVNDLLIITGGPGSGKTSITKAMVSLFRQYYPMATIVAAAPTGRAAKRLSEVLGIHASTLHAL